MDNQDTKSSIIAFRVTPEERAWIEKPNRKQNNRPLLQTRTEARKRSFCRAFLENVAQTYTKPLRGEIRSISKIHSPLGDLKCKHFLRVFFENIEVDFA